MTLPNFIIIGAPRAGTTALYHYLREHPQIYMSPVKETNFFAVEGEKPNFNGPSDNKAIKKLFSINTIEAYGELFNNVSNEVAIGEASPWYLHSPTAATKIKSYIPNVKLIAILRHPIDRAYSNFLQAVRYGYEPLRNFSQALKEEEIRLKKQWGAPWYYKDRGLYSQQLKRYYHIFDSNQIKVYFYDKLSSNSAEMLKSIFEFLNVDSSFKVDTSLYLNKSGIPKNKALDILLNKLRPVKSLLKKSLSAKSVGNLIDLQNRIQNQNLVTVELPSEMRKELTDLYYREDILELQELLRIDLSAWLT